MNRLRAHWRIVLTAAFRSKSWVWGRVFVGRALLLANLLTVVGCNREPGTSARLSELENAFQREGSPPPVAVADSAPGPLVAPATGSAEAQAYVNKAISAVRSSEPAQGVMLLQAAQKMGQLSPQERMAIHNTIRAVTSDLVLRASRGDKRAEADLKLIEQYLSVH